MSKEILRGMSSLVFTVPYCGFLKNLRNEVKALGRELPVILCIGSDRLTGDCLGPLVGNFLIKEYNVPTFVYGTLARTVTALNLRETVTFIQKVHPSKKLLVVDASLGSGKEVGQIRLTRGGICPGAASGKELGRCGDLAITAVVNTLPDKSLATTKLGFVHDLAGVIAITIAASLSTEEVSLSDTSSRLSRVV